MGALHLDTNAYSAAKRGDSDARYILGHAPRVVLSTIVLGELRAGFAAGSRAEQNNRELDEFLGAPRVEVAPVEVATAKVYAALYRQLKRDGHALPTNDMWIAAVVLCEPGEVLYTLDAHFRFIEGLQIVSDARQFQALHHP